MKQTITCISCPMGCRMEVELDNRGEVISVTGNTCARGDRYARQECTLPMRMITAVIHVENSSVPLSVKTATPVPKALIPDVMAELKKLKLRAPICAGEKVLENVCSSGVNVIATRSLP